MPASPASEPIFHLTLPNHRIPSWNVVSRMNWRAKHRLTNATQAAFLSALKAYASDYSMKTGCVKSVWSIAAATLESYLAILQRRRELKPRKGKRRRVKRRGPK